MTMTEHEVERALGYTPCICGVIDGTWHSRCYVGKTPEQVQAGARRALAAARRHLRKRAEQQAADAMLAARKGPTP
jgi:hypothetical protein